MQSNENNSALPEVTYLERYEAAWKLMEQANDGLRTAKRLVIDAAKELRDSGERHVDFGMLLRTLEHYRG